MPELPCKDPSCSMMFTTKLRASAHYRYTHGVGYRANPVVPKVSPFESLPWITIPRDPIEIAAIAKSIVEPLATESPAVVTFWTSLRAHLTALAQRSSSP